MTVVLYTTHCPKCKVLETKLKQKNIVYSENDDTQYMIEKGFKSAPMLEIDGKELLDFGAAIKWIKEVQENAN